MIDLKTLDYPYIIAEIGANHNGDLELAYSTVYKLFNEDKKPDDIRI